MTPRNPVDEYYAELRRRLEVEDAHRQMLEGIDDPKSADPRKSGFAHEEGCPCKPCRTCRAGDRHNPHHCTRAVNLCSRPELKAEYLRKQEE